MAKFRRYKSGDRESAADANALRYTVEGLRNISGADAVIDSRGIHFRTPRKRTDVISRLRITSLAGSTYPGPVMLAKPWDGTDYTGDEFPIRVHGPHAINDVIMGTRPIGGTDQEYDGDNVYWEEVGGKDPYATYRVTLEQTGGGNGTQTTASTWSYTLKYRGQTIAVAQTPAYPRPVGASAAATVGLALTTETGAHQLEIAYEGRGGEACG